MLKKLLLSVIVAVSMFVCCGICANALDGDEAVDEIIQVTVDGEDWDFLLQKTMLLGTLVRADYYAYTPRGDVYYRLVLQFDEDIEKGTYGYKTAFVTLSCDYNAGTQEFETHYNSGYRYDYKFTLTDKNSDWTVYSGKFNGKLMKTSATKYSCSIKCDAFSFEIQEYGNADTYHENTGGFMTPGRNADPDAIERFLVGGAEESASGIAVKDVIQVKVNGKDWDFYLTNVRLLGTLVRADYYAYTPRDDIYYRLVIRFDEDIKPGTYDDEIAPVTLSCDYNASTQKFNTHYNAGYRYDYELTLTDKNSDWTAFAGGFKGKLMKSGATKYSCSISCDEFSFEIQEYGNADSFYESTGGFMTPGSGIDPDAIREKATPKPKATSTPKPKTTSTPKPTVTVKPTGGTSQNKYGEVIIDSSGTSQNKYGEVIIDSSGAGKNDYVDDVIFDDWYEDMDECFSCNGTGECDSCGGDGSQEHITYSVTGNRCRTCEGSGDCVYCNGTGRS